MLLTEAQQRIVLDRLNKTWPAPHKCPLCGQNGPWAFGLLCELREYRPLAPSWGGRITPLLSVFCANCAGTQYFNAIQLGVVDAKTGRILLPGGCESETETEFEIVRPTPTPTGVPGPGVKTRQIDSSNNYDNSSTISVKTIILAVLTGLSMVSFLFAVVYGYATGVISIRELLLMSGSMTD